MPAKKSPDESSQKSSGKEDAKSLKVESKLTPNEIIEAEEAKEAEEASEAEETTEEQPPIIELS